jgi:hypothetical protein
MPNINHCDSDLDSVSSSNSPICIDTHSDTSSSNNNINIDVHSDASSFHNSNASSSCHSNTNIMIDSNSDASFHHANVNIDVNSDASFHNANVNIDVNSDISSSEYGCNNILDIAILYNYTDNKPMTNFVKLKLVPIEVDFDIFKKLFFKKRCHRNNLDIRFLDILFDKLKAALINNILDFYKFKFSVKTKILFKKEIFALVISENIKTQVFLNLDEIILLQELETYKSIVSRMTLNLWIHTLSLGVSIEFLFNIKDIKDIIISEKQQQIDLFNSNTCENDYEDNHDV